MSDILERLDTRWPAEYALQPTTTAARKDVIEIQRLKADARDEIKRLREALVVVNANAERFEREWYLRGDELEQLHTAGDNVIKAFKRLGREKDEAVLQIIKVNCEIAMLALDVALKPRPTSDTF